jgi:hypothetical protein
MAIGALGLSVAANQSFAEEPKLENLKVGGQYHFGLENEATKLIVSGYIYDKVYLKIRYSLLNDKLEYGYVEYQPRENFSVALGQNKERIFGWHRRQTSSTSILTANYLSSSMRPFSYPTALQLTYKNNLLGNFLVQIAEDYIKCDEQAGTCSSWNRLDANGEKVQKQPAVLSEWIGKIGPVQPLVQYAAYDKGKSYTMSFGLRYKTDLFDVYADYVTDNRVIKGNNGVQSVEEENILTGYVLVAELKAGSFTPYFHYSMFDYEQYVAAGVSQPEKNSGYGKWDDNGNTIALGTYWDSWSKAFRPYGAVVMESGDFEDPKDISKTKTMSELKVLLGVVGDF